MRTYTFTIENDQVADDFEAGAAARGFTPEALFAKEVADFANEKRRDDAEAAKPEVTAIQAAEAVREFADQISAAAAAEPLEAVR